MSIKKLLFSFISFLLSWNCLWSQSSVSKEATTVLFIGNSYTHMNDMPTIFEKIAKDKGQKVFVEKTTKSGANLKEHSGRADMFDKIKSRKWDIVVLQGYSREMSFAPEHIDTASMPYLIDIMDSIQKNHSCTQMLLYMTWGYKEGFVERPETDSYEKMQSEIARGYQYISQVLQVPIVPVGRVWQDLRTNYPTINLYDADKAHPNRNGSYTAACTFYTAIFNESAEGAITSTIGSDEALKIQRSAAKIVLADPQKFMLNVNEIKLKSLTHVNGEHHLYCTTNFPSAIKVKWYFGDGKTSSEYNPFHQYKEPGEYQVRLHVSDRLGERYYLRRVYFKPISMPNQVDKPSLKKGNKPFKKI
jgi:hypothetical protein